jgi:hypothetical protein
MRQLARSLSLCGLKSDLYQQGGLAMKPLVSDAPVRTHH